MHALPPSPSPRIVFSIIHFKLISVPFLNHNGLVAAPNPRASRTLPPRKNKISWISGRNEASPSASDPRDCGYPLSPGLGGNA